LKRAACIRHAALKLDLDLTLLPFSHFRAHDATCDRAADRTECAAARDGTADEAASDRSDCGTLGLFRNRDTFARGQRKRADGHCCSN
jgi:hypothetical protein